MNTNKHLNLLRLFDLKLLLPFLNSKAKTFHFHLEIWKENENDIVHYFILLFICCDSFVYTAQWASLSILSSRWGMIESKFNSITGFEGSYKHVTYVFNIQCKLTWKLSCPFSCRAWISLVKCLFTCLCSGKMM